MTRSGKVTIKRIEAGPLSTNTYYIESGEEAILVDPGADSSTIIEMLPKPVKKIAGIISTHGHFDHFLGAAELQEEFGCPFMIGKGEAGVMEWSYRVSPKYIGTTLSRVRTDRYLEEGDAIRFDGSEATVISLPGHTLGSIGIILDDFFITGDTIFRGTIGRTDLGGSMDLMEKTLRRILTMDGNMKVMPGHGPETTLHEEFMTNPFLQDLREED